MESTKGSYNAAVLKFILFSGIGAIMFFVNVDIGGVSVIPIQHIINNQENLRAGDTIFHSADGYGRRYHANCQRKL